jgi:hypothetical protein
MIEVAPPFGKGYCGLLRQQKWDTNDILGMGKILGFGKTNGLGLVALLLNIGSCTPFQMKKYFH